jgi:DnaJ-class molecular chaperone
MDADEDPYAILGIDASATASQIKSAYRKAALRNHPDKQRTEEDRLKATVAFAKISNAYELLTNPSERNQYDSKQQGSSDYPSVRFQDDFFGFHRFHDPFQMFEQVFREEFRHTAAPRSSSERVHRDPFFSDSMMDPFGAPPLFGGSLFDNFGAGMSRGVSRRSDPFEEMRRMQDNMMQQLHSLHQQPDQSSSRYYYSATSSNAAMHGGESVSTRATTRMINGKQQTVTERIVCKADGTVERHLDQTGDEDFPNLEASSSSTQGYLDEQRRLEQHGPVSSSESGLSSKKRRRWFGV